MKGIARESRGLVLGVAVILLIAGGAPSLFAQKLSRAMQLLRVDGSLSGEHPGEALPRGIVKLEINGNAQKFSVDAYNLTGSYADGLAVYIGNATQISNSVLRYVSVLSQEGTNGHWRLAFSANNNAAPPQLGVPSLTDLVGSTVFISASTNTALLRAKIIELVPDPAKLSYQQRVPMYLTNPPLSLNAKGFLRVKYNGKTGASLIEIRAKGLNAGNRYVAGAVSATDTNACAEHAYFADKGVATFRQDTGKGDELPGLQSGTGLGTDDGILTVIDLSGAVYPISDCFGGEHLIGAVPFPPSKK